MLNTRDWVDVVPCFADSAFSNLLPKEKKNPGNVNQSKTTPGTSTIREMFGFSIPASVVDRASPVSLDTKTAVFSQETF